MILLACCPIAAKAQTPPPGTRPAASPQPPQYTPLRWNEDWSYLRTAPRADYMDGLKYIPLDEEGQFYLSLGGQARYRYEYFDNANFGAGPQDNNGFHLLRLLAHADLHAGEHFRVFAQGISANADGREGGERPGIDENDLDLHQAFVDLRLPVLVEVDTGRWTDILTLRGGRQNMMFGAQRLISPLDWTNTRRTFDGLRASLAYCAPGTSLDVFWVRPVIVDESPPDEFFDDDSADFAGIYNTLALPELLEKAPGTRFEQYLLWLDRNAAPFFQAAGNERRFTLGGRFYSNPRPFDVDVEAAYQFGEFESALGDGDISAFFVAVEGGYTQPDAPFAPRLFAGGTYASGDDDPADEDLGTFNQLYPLAHAYLGYADVVGRQNVIDLYAGVDLNLLAGERRFAKKLALQPTVHGLWRASDDDSIYTIGGGVGRGGGDARYVGTELDLLLNWQIDRHFSSYAGFSYVIPGAFIEETGPDEEISVLYVALQFTF